MSVNVEVHVVMPDGTVNELGPTTPADMTPGQGPPSGASRARSSNTPHGLSNFDTALGGAYGGTTNAPVAALRLHVPCGGA